MRINILLIFFAIYVFNIKNSELIIQQNQNKRVAILNEKKFTLKSNQVPNHFDKLWTFFYKKDLLELYPIAICMKKEFALINQIIIKIFSYCSKRFIFEKILIGPLVKEINVFNNEIYPFFTNVHLRYGNFINTNIAIPEINKKISSRFNLQKALFNEKYLVVDYRHEILTIEGKRDMSIFQELSFHWVLVFKREELLKIEDTIDIHNLNHFLKITLPIDESKEFFMEISSLKEDKLIIKNKNQKSYTYIYLKNIPTNESNTLTTSITLPNTNLLEENLDQKKKGKKYCYFLNFFKNSIKKLITLLQMFKKFCQKIISY